MKAISLYEPWASFIMLGWKTIETRTHDRFKSLIKEVILIHAAKKLDDSGIWGEYLGDEQMELLSEKNLSGYFDETRGKILGSVYVNSSRRLYQDDSRLALINCDPIIEVRYGLFLERPCPLIKPIPYRGRQGIFNVPDEMIAAG